MLVAGAGCHRTTRVVNLTSETVPQDLVVPNHDQVVIELLANSGTGFVWQVSPFDTASVTLTNTATRALHATLPGAQAVTAFTFKGVKPGSTLLQFALLRPWEKNTLPAETRAITLTVTDSNAS